MKGFVFSTGDASTPFEITNGMKQGCVLAPVVFSPFFACVLTNALHDLERGVYLRYRLDGFLFYLCSLNAKIKKFDRLILDALLADDGALMAHSESDLQTIVDRFAEASQLFGLTISQAKQKSCISLLQALQPSSQNVYSGN